MEDWCAQWAEIWMRKSGAIQLIRDLIRVLWKFQTTFQIRHYGIGKAIKASQWTYIDCFSSIFSFLLSHSSNFYLQRSLLFWGRRLPLRLQESKCDPLNQSLGFILWHSDWFGVVDMWPKAINHNESQDHFRDPGKTPFFWLWIKRQAGSHLGSSKEGSLKM